MVKTLNGLHGMKSMENSGIGMVQKLVKTFFQMRFLKLEPTISEYLTIQTAAITS